MRGWLTWLSNGHLKPGRDWLAVVLMFLVIGFAGQAWLSGSAEQTITQSFPGWAQILWYGGLVSGALIVLIGIAIHTHLAPTGPVLQGAGLLVLSSLSTGYGLAFLGYSGRADLIHAVYVVFFVLLFALACGARVRQLFREITQTITGLEKLGDLREASQ